MLTSLIELNYVVADGRTHAERRGRRTGTARASPRSSEAVAGHLHDRCRLARRARPGLHGARTSPLATGDPGRTWRRTARHVDLPVAASRLAPRCPRRPSGFLS